jgi:hypothetical protein
MSVPLGVGDVSKRHAICFDTKPPSFPKTSGFVHAVETWKTHLNSGCLLERTSSAITTRLSMPILDQSRNTKYPTYHERFPKDADSAYIIAIAVGKIVANI